MLNGLIVVSAFILLSILLYFEKRRRQKYILPVKSILSTLFVLTVLVQPHPICRYYHFLLAGLILCLAGDVFLALPQKKMFLYGLFSFLSGHIIYIFAFLSLEKAGPDLWIVLLIIMLVSGAFYHWLVSYLGSMKIPVLLYVVVISIMLVAAWSVMGNLSLLPSGRTMIVAGAFSFYLSDMFVARDRFYKREFLNRLVGLPLYYTGQFLFSFSVGLLK
ncbi:MAG: lysoplasmalogenase [Deltaproteobacteria bacterium]|nr:lysoplasmalogenase [Deltaproteobacteria bacterium]